MLKFSVRSFCLILFLKLSSVSRCLSTAFNFEQRYGPTVSDKMFTIEN